MKTFKIFLASSFELAPERKELEVFINRRNKEWVHKGVFLELVVWEDFLDVMSRTRLQQEYNQAIKDCALFVMLFCAKVGKFTEEEFDTAFGHFLATNKPFILTYFKDDEAARGKASREDLTSLWAFQDKLKALGHYQKVYKNTEDLMLHFGQQLDKLAAGGFIEFRPEEAAGSGGDVYQATLTGNGAIAQGKGAQAVGAGGVLIGGNNSGNINMGNQNIVNTGGGAYVSGGVHTGGGNFIGRDWASRGKPDGEK